MDKNNSYRNAIVTLLIFFSAITISVTQDFGVTVFGTDLITKDEILNNYSENLNTLKALYGSDDDTFKPKTLELENILLKLGDFSFVRVHLFKSYTNEYDFIIDYVESKEAESRLNYRTIEAKQFDDPEGLIGKWKEYEELSFQLFREGEIKDYTCPVIHCIWSFNNSKLDPYLQYFNTYAPKHKESLIKILNSGDSPEQRASAAFLLVHSEMTNEELLHTLMPSIRDPESIVRNNSMRVIYYIVRAFPEINFSVPEIIDALDFPSFTSRNKALVILRSTSLNGISRKDAERLSDILIEILMKKDAHNFHNAYAVIKKLSNKDYGIDDIEGWKEWRKNTF